MRFEPYAAALASAAVLATATPPIDWVPGVGLGLVGLAWTFGLRTSEDETSAQRKEAALRGFVFGVGVHVGAQAFVLQTARELTVLGSWLPWIVFLAHVAFQSLPWAFVGFFRSILVARGVPSWFAFSAAIYFGSFAPSVLPWSLAGLASPWPSLVQLADVIGERGVGALFALAAGWIASALPPSTKLPRREAIFRGVVGAAGVGAIHLVGLIRIDGLEAESQNAPRAVVAAIDPAVDPRERYDVTRANRVLAALTELTLRVERENVEFTVWPETAYPYVLEHGVRSAPPAERAVVQPNVHGPILTGLITQDARGRKYNSAVVATRDGTLGPSYDKVHLVPFGERIPFSESELVRRWLPYGPGITPGDGPVALTAGRLNLGVLNCVEDTLPSAGRAALVYGPNLLVNITNDGWFAGSHESENHLRMATLRSVELRRDMVRAVNMGATSWVDAMGRVRGRAHDGILIAQPSLREGSTVYAKAGDLPLGLFFVAMLIRAGRARRRGTRPSPSV